MGRSLKVLSGLLIFFLIATMLATQYPLFRNTISTVLGGDRRVLVSGDASKYMYYTADAKDFIYYQTDSKFDSKEETLKEAKLLNQLIVEEGMVLLKNDGGALPIATTESTVDKASSAPKISVFGKNSVNLVYGGSGSAGGEGGDMGNLYDSLAAAGYEVNPDLKAFYEDNGASGSGRPSNPSMSIGHLTGFPTGETAMSRYSDELIASYEDYSDAAIVVISRIGGEAFDLPRTMKWDGSSYNNVAGANQAIPGAGSMDDHYLELDRNEKALLRHVTSNFDKVILLINCGTSMELGFVESGEYGDIDAAIWMGYPGNSGINALGQILNGNASPSGRTVDTFAVDFTKDPSWYNFGNNLIADGNRYTTGGSNSNAYFVDYEEGIYVGYRYYETRAYTQQRNYADYEWYDSNVVYPFGYGLSYADFTWTIVETSITPGADLGKDDTISITVNVHNNSDKYDGKEVVQLYYTAPYYDEIEKAHVVLGDYQKVYVPAGGDAQVTLTLKVSDMASYDYSDANKNGFKGYELDDGIYHLRLGKNAHDAWTDSEFDITYNVPQTLDEDYRVFGFTYEMDIDGKADGNDNQFDDVSAHIQNNLMSRKDFEGTFPKAPTVEDREVSSDFLALLEYIRNDKDAPYYTENMPTQGLTAEQVEIAYQLYDVIQYNSETGEVTVDYDDPKWEIILNQITVDEMANLIGTGNFNTSQIESISKPKTTDPDSPVGFTNFMGDPTVYGTCQYAGVSLMGATWNKELMHDFGVMVGNEGIWGNVRGDGRTYSGWYAPAVNIHRSAFGGRNWEYFSEDPMLSGMMGANIVLGAKEKGVYTYVKHFALNDQETSRDSNGLITWASEQAMRELYLKPFQIIVEDGKTTAMMSSFNRIGTTWAGGSYELLTNVLRKEWGFKGMVITDYAKGYGQYMDENQMIRAGGDLVLFQDQMPEHNNPSATQVSLMRQATKNILYTVAGSNAMNGIGEGVVYEYQAPYWVLALWAINALLALGVVFTAIFKRGY
ncbi:MAG: glycoside hydrolase family 3 C-terminal domain-containing protein [Clostridia bacterium]|nr:glycoside hydrolase family 3 C-terminal domain-containing protein [Clostridia bacterium]